MIQSTAILEDVFKHEFSGSSWRKYTVQEAVALLESKIQEKGPPQSSSLLLLRKAKTCKTMPELLQVCTNFLLGECHDK